MSESTMPPLESSSSGAAQAPPPPPPPPPWWPEPKRRRPLWKRLLTGCVVLILVFCLMIGASLFVSTLVGRAVSKGGLYKSVLEPGRDDQVVAVYEVAGLIDDEQAERIEVFYRRVANDAHVKAVVLRVNSPGGYISACDRIHRRMEDLKVKGKKVVVSMGAVAASGGYYISAPADAIYAEPTTTTGSIGVLGCWPVIKGTLEKYGAKMVIVRSTKTRAWKAWRNPFEDPADYQIEEVRKTLDVMQKRFEDLVRQGRGGKLEVTTVTKTYTGADGEKFTVEETVPFNGKAFLAAEAESMGLVDKIGYQDDATEEASRLAWLLDPKVVKYGWREGLLEQLGSLRAGPMINLKALDEIQTPRLMMIWKISP